MLCLVRGHVGQKFQLSPKIRKDSIWQKPVFG